MINERNVKAYCCEDLSKIENYDKAIADKTKIWDCHHRLEVQGQFFNSKELLERCGMYWNRPANELIFLTRSDHRKLHRQGRSCSEETRKKISETKRGRKPSEETRKKMSETRKGKPSGRKGKHHTEEARRKMSEAKKGKKMSEEFRRKMSEAAKGNTNVRGRRWFNDGTKSIMSMKCPEGFKPGRLFQV